MNFICELRLLSPSPHGVASTPTTPEERAASRRLMTVHLLRVPALGELITHKGVDYRVVDVQNRTVEDTVLLYTREESGQR